jgi:hypothetical protein
MSRIDPDKVFVYSACLLFSLGIWGAVIKCLVAALEASVKRLKDYALLISVFVGYGVLLVESGD